MARNARLFDHQIRAAYAELTSTARDMWIVDLNFGGLQIHFRRPRSFVTQVYVGRFCRIGNGALDISQEDFTKEVRYAEDVLQGRRAA
jgi:hypothetical protein